jgi:hypothetical protein
LVFRRYGKRYFLREVWFLGNGRLLPESKAERQEATLANKAASLVSTVVVEATVD